VRGYHEHRVKLLLWAGLCFIGFALGNILLIVDVVIGDTYDLALFRSLPVLGGLLILLFGLVMES